MKHTHFPLILIFVFLAFFPVMVVGQSDYMSSGSAYTPKVYQPFSNISPSEMNYPLSSPMRRAPGDGSDDDDDWTPDDWQGGSVQDPGEAMPVGSPWVLLVLVAVYAMCIVFRNYKKSNAMRKFSLIICILLFVGANGYATDYFFSNGGAGNGDGTSWTNAKSAGYLRDALEGASAGDNFYLKAENFYTGTKTEDSDVLWVIPQGVNIYGGYPSSKTGTDVTINYDTLKTGYTCFRGSNYTGSRVQVYIGKNSGSWSSTSATDYYSGFATVTIKGVSFQDAPGRNTEGYYTGNGLLVKHAKVDFYHCRFQNNKTPDDKRLAALVAWGSQMRCYDCVFRNNNTGGDGGAAFCIRQRNNKSDGISSDKSVVVFERCEFTDNISQKGGYAGGGVIDDNAGDLYMINCTVKGSRGTKGGAGIRVSGGSKGYFISNTFVDNMHTTTDKYGEQISSGSSSACYLVNNIITQTTHGTDYYAVKLDGNKTSGGYNIIGKTNLTSGTSDNINNTSNTQSAIFSSNTIGNHGGISQTIVPSSNRNTCTVAQLQTIVSGWSLPTVVTEKLRLDLDQRGYPRGAGNNGTTTCGAYDFHGNARFYCNNTTGKGAKNGFSWDDALPSTQLAYDLHYPGALTSFYAMAGAYSPAKVDGGADGDHWRIAEGIHLYGGYPEGSTGINRTIDYTTADRSVFSAAGITQTGPFVQIGKDAGDSSTDDTNTATGFSPVSFHGITFSDANWSADGETGVMIFLKHARADFHYCSFLNNHNTGSNSGAAIQSWGSQLRCYDCVFRGNSGSTNVCIRQRARNNGTSAGNEGFTLLERCELTDNTSTGNWAGAIAVGGNSGSFAMFNCTLNGTTQNKGGAIRVDAGGRFYAAGCTFFNNYNTTTTPGDLGHGESFSCESSTTVKLANNIFVNTNDNYSNQHPVISLNSSMTSFVDNGYNTFGTVKLEGQSLNINDEYATSADNVNQYTVLAVFGRGKLANHGGVSLTISPAKSWDGNMTVTDLATAVSGWDITDLSGNAVTPNMTVDQRNIARNSTTVRGACEAGTRSGVMFFSPAGAGNYSGDSWTNANKADNLAAVLQNAGYGVTFYLQRGSYANGGKGYIIPEGVIIRGGYPSGMTGTNTALDYSTLNPATDLSVFDANKENTSQPYVRIGLGAVNQDKDDYLHTDFSPCEVWGCRFTNAQRMNSGDYIGDMVYVKHARADFRYCMFDNNKTVESSGKYRKNGAITAWGSVVRCYDCTFEDNFSGGSGSAFVLRQHNSTTAEEHRPAYLSLGVFERCLFSDNTVRADSAYGGTAAMADHAGTLVLANNTFRGGSCHHNGGALRISTGDTLYAVSNTFYHNTATATENYGDALSIGSNARTWLLNNIILGTSNTDKKPAIHIQSGAVLKSEGYNVLGTVTNSSGTYTQSDNDLKDQTQTAIFGGDNVSLTTKGVRRTMVPIGTLNSPTLRQLRSVVGGWNLPEEVTEHLQLDLDQIAHTRAATTHSGAYDADGGRRYRLVCRYDDKEYASNGVIENNETMSLYFHTGGTLQMQKRDGIWTDTMAAVYAATVGMTKDTVYTVTFNSDTKQPNASSAAVYDGLYYVRVGAYDDQQSAYPLDSMAMTAFDPTASIGYDGTDITSYYNRYWYSRMEEEADVTATVGNAYNENLLPAWLTADKYTDNKGHLLRDSYIRYGYNPGCNKLTRTLMDADMESNTEYLTLYGEKVYTDADGETAAGVSNKQTFTYMSDGQYQCNLYVKNGATVIVRVYYGTDESYLFGITGETPNTHGVVIGGDGIVYALRFVYDFKENKFHEAWLPSGAFDDFALNADLFLVRRNNGSACQLTLSDADRDGEMDITDIHQAYFVLEIDRSAVATNGPAYWFSLPYDCAITDIEGQPAELYGKSWMIQYYKGQARAENGWHETQTYWGNKAPTGKLTANQGYVLIIDPARVEWGKTTTGTDVLRLYFPTDGSKTYHISQLTDKKTVVPSHTCAITGREVKDSHWNIIGTPSLSDIRPTSVSAVDSPDDFPAFIYEWDWNDGNQRYTPTAINDEFTFKAFHGYMVQYAGTIDWAAHAELQENPALARPRTYMPEKTAKKTRMQLSLMSGTALLDRTYVCLSSDATEGYDLNRDLSKIIDPVLPQIWTVCAGEEWAANNMPAGTERVPLTISLPEAGACSLVLSESDAESGVFLLDKQTGQMTDLLKTQADLVLPAGTVSNRYELLFRSDNTPTGHHTASIEQQPAVKIIRDGQLYILKNGRLYTALGGVVENL